MPTTINGIGTQYYGKKNLRGYHAVCDSCGFQGRLSDYETGYYFVLVFIPVIPLGKKQILGECPNCRRHRVMPLSQWETLRESEIENAMDRLAEAPEEPARALELLGTLTMFNRPEEALDLANATRKSHAEDVDVQIGLGGWYESIGETAQSEACFQRAVELDPERPACRRIKAITQLETGKPSEAKATLAYFRVPSEHYEPALFMMLAKAFQAKSMPAEALAEYEELMQNVPALAKDRSLKKEIKRCQKQLNR
jgi:tetratricopeptide (TPR) repeat protein